MACCEVVGLECIFSIYNVMLCINAFYDSLVPIIDCYHYILLELSVESKCCSHVMILSMIQLELSE